MKFRLMAVLLLFVTPYASASKAYDFLQQLYTSCVSNQTNGSGEMVSTGVKSFDVRMSIANIQSRTSSPNGAASSSQLISLDELTAAARVVDTNGVKVIQTPCAVKGCVVAKVENRESIRTGKMSVGVWPICDGVSPEKIQRALVDLIKEHGGRTEVTY